MAKPDSLFTLFQRSWRRKGKVDDHVTTDPGDAAFARAMDQLQSALPPAVNVVGNAASLLDRPYGPIIDAVPTIRFNSAQIQDPAAQGSRWDFVATSNEDTLAHYAKTPPAFHTLLFTPYFDLHLDRPGHHPLPVPVLVYPIRLSLQLMAKLRARPTTGMQILWLLDALGRREVGIFGFDWKRTPTFYDPKRDRDPHNHFGEMMLARRLIRRNRWVLHR
ncbi:MAG: hypothetical protein ACK5IB_05000 [Qingshengfaniella sp.]